MYPTLFHLGHLNLPTFGALAAIGLIAALLLSERSATLVGLNPQRLWNAGIFAVIAAFSLSRLLLIITYWKSFRAFPILVLAVPSLTATGLLLTAIATAVWLYLHRIPLLAALDAWAPGAALVCAALALGHFAEGSDPGLPSTLPWALPSTPGDPNYLHPVALYLAVIALVLAVAAIALLRRGPVPGTTAGATLAVIGLAQFLLSFLRQPGETAVLGLDLLQIAALGMILAGFALLSRTFAATERQ